MPPAHVSTEEIAGEMRLRTPYRGIETGQVTLRLRVTVAPRLWRRRVVEREVVIDVDDLAVEVREADGSFVLGAGAIDALFIVERQPRCGFLPWFGVFARRRGKADSLVLETPDPAVARYVERSIEMRLGLGDEPIRGEIKVRSR